ncbi:radical SAM protein [Streptomyces sp. NPDC059104]|uniref:radical SAM protein n=1 Tax=Streptomyces sp. NPDC059104 TaxID=3346729 RepID=UPI0036D11372
MTAPARPRRLLPLLTAQQIASLQLDLADPVEYRKSGLSLNHVIGCPLDCSYCIRHIYANFDMKIPRRLMSDEDAVKALTGHKYFRPHVTPIQLFNKATEPMLPVVKPHTFNTLRLLDEQGLTNHALIITRWRVSEEDTAVFNAFQNIKVTVLVTYSGISDSGIEPVDSKIAAASLKTLYANADRYRTVLYWRPIVPGLNDSDLHLNTARELADHAHAAVFTGLFFRDEIADYYKAHDLPSPYEDTARRKIMPEDTEARILDLFRRPADSAERWGPLFRKTSCAVAYAHGLADYNGHYGIRELCDICPKRQLGLCAAAWRAPPSPTPTPSPGPWGRAPRSRSPNGRSSRPAWPNTPATSCSTDTVSRSTTAPTPTASADTAAPRSGGTEGSKEPPPREVLRVAPSPVRR